VSTRIRVPLVTFRSTACSTTRLNICFSVRARSAPAHPDRDSLSHAGSQS
jgi:hypothetical protein